MILGIIVGILIIDLGIYYIKEKNKKEEISYEDGVVCKNFFKEIEIDISSKKVTRDGKETSMIEEFDVPQELENMLFSSGEEMKKYLSNSVFDITFDNNIFKIQNPYQRKCLLVKADNIKDKVENEKILEIYPHIYIINFDTEKLTKAMYNYYKDKPYIEKIYLDEVYLDEPINDISQTVYGDAESDLKGYYTLITTKIGMDNYKNIIYENGNPKEVTVATIGYGINIENEIFNERITKKRYNYMLNNKNISETIPQGSRIAEVIVDSTTNNVKILPIVIVTEDGYTSLCAIIKALYVATKNSDVICYEIKNPQNEFINLVINEAFKANVPICTVSSSIKESYPASSGFTLVASSLDKDFNITDYSGKGSYIDFAIPSTDVEEIFNQNSSVSRWSGSHYSNAELAAIISLIKTYDKDVSILDIYNFIRNFATDLGDSGKDDLYGYGVPIFSNLKISDIDKSIPLFKEIKYDNESWELLKKVKMNVEDNIRIMSWALTKNETEPNLDEWQKMDSLTNKLEQELEITENGDYYIFVEDSAGNRSKQPFKIEKIDNIPPKITYSINKDTLNEGYVTINIEAEDEESGLSENPYSFDKINWSNENNKKIVKQNGRYKSYVKDKLENISEVEILIDFFNEEGVAEIGEGNLIQSIYVSAEWDGNTNNNIQITLNDIEKITAWQITTDSNIPTNFIEIKPETSINQETNTINNNAENTITSTNTNVNSNNNTTINNENTKSIINNNTLTTNTNSNINNTTNNIDLNRIVTITENQTTRKNDLNIITSRANQNLRDYQTIIKVSLETDKLYYMWVKDNVGNWNYQTFKIHKKQI